VVDTIISIVLDVIYRTIKYFINKYRNRQRNGVIIEGCSQNFLIRKGEEFFKYVELRKKPRKEEEDE
jgi:hypothetical protein